MTQRLKYTELSPQGIAAMRALEHYCNAETLLDPVLLELVRLRVSHRNGCEYCIGMHTHELGKHNETANRIARTVNPEGFDGYTHGELAAMRWADVVTDIQQGHASDADYAAAREHFSEKELVDLTLAIVSINAWNRMAIAFRTEHRSSLPADTPAATPEPVERNAAPEENRDSPVGDDGGKVAVDE